jgi:hypothetical protein
MGKPKGKRSLGKPRRKWKGNIEIDLKEIRDGAWTGVTRFRIATDSGLL